MSDELDGASFNKNYKVLKDTADWLSQQKEPDIDQLVPKVERAMQAYQICKKRLDAVQATMGQYFERDGAVEPAISSDGDGDLRRQPGRPTPSSDGDRKPTRLSQPPDGDGDVPF